MNRSVLRAVSIPSALVAGLTASASGQCLEFTEPIALPEVTDPGALLDVAAADLDDDGRTDLAVAANTGALAVLRNERDGVFAIDQTIAFEEFAFFRQVLAGDLDGDDDPDLVVNSGAVSVIFNDGGVFGLPVAVEVVSGFVFSPDTALVDVDGDGDLDIVTNQGFDPIAINDGQGGFATTVDYDLGFPAPVEARVAVGDVNGDLAPDIVGVNGAGAANTIGIGVALNDGAGSFTTQPFTETLALLGATAIHLVDADGDGDLDLAVRRQSARMLTVFANDGTGQFGAPQDRSLPAGFGRRMTSADVDGDGRTDLALGADEDGPATIYRGGEEGLGSAIIFAPVFGGGVTVAQLDDEPGLDLASGRTVILNRTVTPIPGDINGNGIVDIVDLLLLLSNWS